MLLIIDQPTSFVCVKRFIRTFQRDERFQQKGRWYLDDRRQRVAAEIDYAAGIVSLDADVNTTMKKDGGVALIINGFGEGEGRVRQAVEGNTEFSRY